VRREGWATSKYGLAYLLLRCSRIMIAYMIELRSRSNDQTISWQVDLGLRSRFTQSHVKLSLLALLVSAVSSTNVNVGRVAKLHPNLSYHCAYRGLFTKISTLSRQKDSTHIDQDSFMSKESGKISSSHPKSVNQSINQSRLATVAVRFT
jgi:hypothetical protein